MELWFECTSLKIRLCVKLLFDSRVLSGKVYTAEHYRYVHPLSTSIILIKTRSSFTDSLFVNQHTATLRMSHRARRIVVIAVCKNKQLLNCR